MSGSLDQARDRLLLVIAFMASQLHGVERGAGSGGVAEASTSAEGTLHKTVEQVPNLPQGCWFASGCGGLSLPAMGGASDAFRQLCGLQCLDRSEAHLSFLQPLSLDW